MLSEQGCGSGLSFIGSGADPPIKKTRIRPRLVYVLTMVGVKSVSQDPRVMIMCDFNIEPDKITSTHLCSLKD